MKLYILDDENYRICSMNIKKLCYNERCEMIFFKVMYNEMHLNMLSLQLQH